MSVIEVSHLTRDYGHGKGVFDLSMEINAGEVFGFLGPNGAGKTTTIRHLMGFIRPRSGFCTIEGRDCWRQAAEIQRNLGYIPGEITFFEEMNGAEYLRFLQRYRGMPDAGRTAELVERFELTLRGKIKKMSKGMKQKIGIVAAFMHDPDILILDEPTSGLDPLMQREFFSILREKNQKGMTVFLSSHILSEIQRYCSRAAIIRKGQIIASGSVEELSRTSAKRVTVHGKFTPEGLDGIRDLQSTEEESSFLYSGDINLLLQVLSSQPIKDLNISEPDLEEIFLHYYTEGGNIQ